MTIDAGRKPEAPVLQVRERHAQASPAIDAEAVLGYFIDILSSAVAAKLGGAAMAPGSGTMPTQPIDIITSAVAAKLGTASNSREDAVRAMHSSDAMGFLPGVLYDAKAVSRILFDGDERKVYRIPESRLPRRRELGKVRVRFMGVDLLYYCGVITKETRDAFQRTQLAVLQDTANPSPDREDGKAQ